MPLIKKKKSINENNYSQTCMKRQHKENTKNCGDEVTKPVYIKDKTSKDKFIKQATYHSKGDYHKQYSNKVVKLEPS
jgi:hypothetical protein